MYIYIYIFTYFHFPIIYIYIYIYISVCIPFSLYIYIYTSDLHRRFTALVQPAEAKLEAAQLSDERFVGTAKAATSNSDFECTAEAARPSQPTQAVFWNVQPK